MKFLTKNLNLWFVSLTLTACTSSQSLPQHNKAEFYAELPYNWIAQVNFAAEDFKSTNAYKNYQDTKHGEYCFEVETYGEGSKFYVNILPKHNIVEKDGVMILDPDADDYCGRGLSYEFDENGQFLRKIPQR